MGILKEKKNDSAITEISDLYHCLNSMFGDVDDAFRYWDLKQMGLIPERKKPSIDDVKAALHEGDGLLERLRAGNKKFKPGKRVFEERYRDGLTFCQLAIAIMSGVLNAFWKFGGAGKRRTPFDDITSYKFIVNRLIFYMDGVNKISKSINSKTARFNAVNSDLPPLPVLEIVSIPSWARRL